MVVHLVGSVSDAHNEFGTDFKRVRLPLSRRFAVHDLPGSRQFIRCFLGVNFLSHISGSRQLPAFATGLPNAITTKWLNPRLGRPAQKAVRRHLPRPPRSMPSGTIYAVRRRKVAAAIMSSATTHATTMPKLIQKWLVASEWSSSSVSASTAYVTGRALEIA